jgi:TRAP-type C4-dicarboxylate transport system permease small subunit
MRKHLKLIFSLLTLAALLVLPYFVFAQSAPTTTQSSALTKLQTVAGPGYNTNITLPTVVGTVIRSALSLLGVIFIIVLIVAGFRWMTASGNEEKVTKAQNAVKRGIIGLIIVVSAWAFWTFLLERLIIGTK